MYSQGAGISVVTVLHVHFRGRVICAKDVEDMEGFQGLAGVSGPGTLWPYTEHSMQVIPMSYLKKGAPALVALSWSFLLPAL